MFQNLNKGVTNKTAFWSENASSTEVSDLLESLVFFKNFQIIEF